MKKLFRLMTLAAATAVGLDAANAALNIPSDGSDGALVITSDTTIDLSQAATADWDADNSANAGKGIYDSNKWAIVFKYSSVTIQGGATVTFKNHASRAPVVWLVQGDATINGTVSLNGQDQAPSPMLAEPGPGGFRGGAGSYSPGAIESPGFGPGGGAIDISLDGFGNFAGGGGSYGGLGNTAGGAGVKYGNPSLLPLIGGSGGAGTGSRPNNSAAGGGAGGGAMLVACAGTLSVSGTVRANGGAGNGSGGGSGGGIRLICDTLSGNGNVNCLGGLGTLYGGVGRIRLERVTNASSMSNLLPDPSVVNLTSGATPQIWVPTNGPTVKVVSVGEVPAPVDPRAGFGAIGADVVLPQVTNTTVVVETVNVEQASVVKVRATPRANGQFSEATATVTTQVSEDPLVLRWTANLPVLNGYSAVQVQVVRP